MTGRRWDLQNPRMLVGAREWGRLVGRLVETGTVRSANFPFRGEYEMRHVSPRLSDRSSKRDMCSLLISLRNLDNGLACEISIYLSIYPSIHSSIYPSIYIHVYGIYGRCVPRIFKTVQVERTLSQSWRQTGSEPDTWQCLLL